MSIDWQMMLEAHARRAADGDATADDDTGFDGKFFVVAVVVGAFLGIVVVAALLR